MAREERVAKVRRRVHVLEDARDHHRGAVAGHHRGAGEVAPPVATLDTSPPGAASLVHEYNNGRVVKQALFQCSSSVKKLRYLPGKSRVWGGLLASLDTSSVGEAVV